MINLSPKEKELALEIIKRFENGFGNKVLRGKFDLSIEAKEQFVRKIKDLILQ